MLSFVLEVIYKRKPVWFFFVLLLLAGDVELNPGPGVLKINCCRCNRDGRCKNCSCVKRGLNCESCLPSRLGHCSNLISAPSTAFSQPSNCSSHSVPFSSTPVSRSLSQPLPQCSSTILSQPLIAAASSQPHAVILSP